MMQKSSIRVGLMATLVASVVLGGCGDDRSPLGPTRTASPTTSPTIAAPSVVAITPASGGSDGGTAVTITGTNFLPGAAVLVGEAPALEVTVLSSTAISATTGIGRPGLADVVVSISGQSARLVGGFTYTPVSTADQTGRIADLQAARDIIDWNMLAEGGASYRRQDRICRWDLPIPVFVRDGPDRELVNATLDYWRDQTGILFRIIPSDTLPRILIRFGTDGLAPWGGGRALVDGTNPDNSARSGLVVYHPDGCPGGSSSPACLFLYRHELGHALGIFVNTSAGLMGGALELSDRERRMMAALYALPHGARVEADGTWKVLGW